MATKTNKTAAKKPNKRTTAPKKKLENPVDSNTKVGTVSDFKKSKYAVVMLPSGIAIQAKRISLSALFQEGEIPNALVPMVQDQLDKNTKKGKAPRPKQTATKEDARDMGEFLDQVACMTFVEPPLHPAPKPGEKRDDSILYADDVSITDKMFLMNWAFGGSPIPEKFLQQLDIDLAVVS